MKTDLEEHLKETFKLKDSMHYLSLLQKIKTFADSQLAEFAGKNDQEKAQTLFNALLNIRDTASVELVEYTICKRVEASVQEHNDVVISAARSQEQESKDLETFAVANADDQKKNKV